MKSSFESIEKGLKEAIEHAQGKEGSMRVFKPAKVDVKKLREKTGLTQAQFAAIFGFGLGTLRHWERGDRYPTGAALVLLNIIDRDPAGVLRALNNDKKINNLTQKTMEETDKGIGLKKAKNVEELFNQIGE